MLTMSLVIYLIIVGIQAYNSFFFSDENNDFHCEKIKEYTSIKKPSPHKSNIPQKETSCSEELLFYMLLNSELGCFVLFLCVYLSICI